MELLNGKCKEEFLKYLKDNYQKQICRFQEDVISLATIIEWEETPLSMQYGVLVDFFDERDIILEPTKVIKGWVIYINGISDFEDSFETRNKARISAIKKANEIFNNKSK